MTDAGLLWPVTTVPTADMVVDAAAATDLHIEPILTAILGADEYRLRAWFRRPVCDIDTVRYRQEVFADLTDGSAREVFHAFATGMRNMRQRLAAQDRLHHRCQRQWWQLSAAAQYVETVTRFAAALAVLPLNSRALIRWREFVSAYVDGPDFGRLTTAVRQVRQALGEVRYSVRIVDRTLEVSPVDTTPDYSATIAKLFSRFGVGAPQPPRPRWEWDDNNHMEEQILDHVAALYPLPFARLTEFARDYEQFAAAEVLAFDREIQFYLTFLAFVDRIGDTTRTMCLPRLAVRGAPIHAEDGFDLALLTRRRRGDAEVVCNDLRLSGRERVMVVTGPNQGGKTTFARAFGQLVYFAGLGCPVPARTACLPLADRLCTHFERAEQATDPDGRLAEELSRIRDTLEAATADSVIVLNESFSSTSTADAVRIGRDVLDRIVERGTVAVWVTFFDELAETGPGTVSMVAATDPDDPSRRTFRIERRPADGHAHAVVLAERFGLTRDLVTARITACR
ncbi:MutS-related protein [Nocardia blacklockiae]|uniref:MutS-related protein n=1 Tax=Nocardia blacklockiae TaxID=480036 RepID=UPI001894CABB|nr:DNA mismatch repair protein MutS [Nocardia blacklockiae]MBF6170727.1 DNA mismatch repair protein MutS [Nocardia blacklockiae]